MSRNNPHDILPHLRRELKQWWPAVKFSVRRGRGTAYGWADVRWTDGPSERAVKSVCQQYQSQYFDGMDDGYHATGNSLPEGCTGLSGVGVHRSYSDRFIARVREEAIRQHPELTDVLTSENVVHNVPEWHRNDGNGYARPYAILRTLAENRTATLWGLLPATPQS